MARYFVAAYPGRTALLIALLLGAGLSEGVGLLTLLPLLQVVVGGAPADGPAERAVLGLVRGVGAEPTAGVLLALMVGALWLKGTLRWLAMRRVGDTVARVARDLRVRLMRALLAARWRHLGTERAGAIATAIGRDAIWSSSAYRHACAGVAGAIQVAVYAVVVVLVSWRVALLALAGAGVLVLVLGGLVRMSRRAGAEQTTRARALTSRLLEVLGGLKVIRGMGRESRHLSWLEEEARALEAAERRQVLAVETLNAFQEPLLALLLAPVVWVLAGGAIPFSSLLVGVFLVHRLAARAHHVQSEYQGMVGAEAAFRAIHEQAAAAEAEREPEWGAGPVPALREGLRLRGVRVRYGPRVVLDGVDLEVPAGRLTAVVGPSGTGKTTLLDLLLGLETPGDGEVLVDGVSLTGLDRDAWRAGVGYLSQDPALMHDTIAANVTLGAEADPGEIRRALEQAEVWDRVAALPGGVDTVVGERGARLSGGERQRLALARALLLRPRLLVLDEATSELDVETERAIWRTIAGLTGEMTVIAATHRPAVLEFADVVVALEDGRAVPVREPRGDAVRVPPKSAFLLPALGLLIGAGCESATEPPLPPLAELPADLAAVELTATGSLGVPYVMLELRDPQAFSGFVAVNGEGRPVWYFRTTGAPFSFTRRANGNLVLLDQERGLVEVSPEGTVIAELAQEARPGRRMHHDVTVTPDHTILFLAEDVRPVGEEMVTGEALWEWVPETGETTLRWSSFDHLSWTLDRGDRSRPDDWLHANSIAFGPSGNVLVSFHFLNQVVSIAPGYGPFQWRLGGVRATIPVPDPPFSGQHTARIVGAGRLLLFDNGFEREEERYSRAVEYALVGGGAEVLWEWRPERDNWARVISGAARMPNGHTLVGFGTLADPGLGTTGPIEVYEVDRDGGVRWHLEVAGAVRSMYRATPLDRL